MKKLFDKDKQAFQTSRTKKIQCDSRCIKKYMQCTNEIKLESTHDLCLPATYKQYQARNWTLKKLW